MRLLRWCLVSTQNHQRRHLVRTQKFANHQKVFSQEVFEMELEQALLWICADQTVTFVKCRFLWPSLTICIYLLLGAFSVGALTLSPCCTSKNRLRFKETIVLKIKKWGINYRKMKQKAKFLFKPDTKIGMQSRKKREHFLSPILVSCV